MLVKDTACKANGKIFKPHPLTSENLPLDALSFQRGIGYRYYSKDNNHFICNLLLYKEHVAHKIASIGAYLSTSETKSRNEQKRGTSLIN